MHCSNLAEQAIQSALLDYKNKIGANENDNGCNSCCRRCDDVHADYEDED
jgi:hypothetical protein